MEKNYFKGCYEAEDGYVGGSRPHYFRIREADIEEDMEEETLRNLFQDEMHSAFEQSIIPYGKNEDEFVKWAQEMISAKNG